MLRNRNKYPLFLSLISGSVLLVFILFALGSGPMHELFPLDFGYSHKVKEDKKHEVEVQFGDDVVYIYEGEQNEHGQWTGIITMDVISMENGEQVSETKFYTRDGVAHGHFESIIYNNDQPDHRIKGYFKDGRDVHPSGKLPLYPKDARDGESACKFFRDYYSIDEILLLALGFDSTYLSGFFNALETELYAEAFGPDDFDDHYESALEVLEETPYDSIIEVNEAMALFNGFGLVKHHPFRLAVIDRYLEGESASVDLLESRYPGYVSMLEEEAEITKADLTAFCRQFDSCMASYGTLDLEDPYLVDSIDSWIYRAIFTIYESGEEDTQASLKSSLDPALLLLRDLPDMKRQIAAILESKMESADPPETAELILYTIFMSYLEGDLIKKSVFETWIRNKGVIVMPQVGTDNLKGVSGTSVRAGGYVFYDGGEDLIEKGVCWGKTYDPTVEINKLSSSVATDSFEVVISGLEMGMTYYTRAYATNSQGTAYGSTVSFVAGEVTGVETPGAGDGEFMVYPNPVMDIVRIDFRLEQEGKIGLEIYTLNGQRVVLHDAGMMEAGQHHLEIDLIDLVEGTYVCRIMRGKLVLGTAKVVVAR